jgi:hypothetical protein
MVTIAMARLIRNKRKREARNSRCWISGDCSNDSTRDVYDHLSERSPEGREKDSTVRMSTQMGELSEEEKRRRVKMREDEHSRKCRESGGLGTNGAV